MTRKVVHPELPKTETSETEEAKQEFDTANYFKEAMALRKPLEPIIKKVAVIADVRIGRPHPDTWFQCNPDPQAALESYVVRDKEKNYYYVTAEMQTHPLLYPRLRAVTLVEAAVWPPGVPYIIPFHHPSPDRHIPAYSSAWVAFEQAKSGIWTQMNWADGAFQVHRAEDNPHPPTFSGKPMWELLALGFKQRIINNAGHQYVKDIAGIVAG
jgi:hypothetical protein